MKYWKFYINLPDDGKRKKPSSSRGLFTRLSLNGGFGKIKAAVSFTKEVRIFA